MLICIVFNTKAQQKNSVIRDLDKALINSHKYENSKQFLIQSKKESLSKANSKEIEYNINVEIANDYYVYQSDSARLYANKALVLAKELKDAKRIIDSKIVQARIAAKSGAFPVVSDLLDDLAREKLSDDQHKNYLRVYSEYLIYLLEYMQSEGTALSEAKHLEIRDSLISILPKNSPEYAINIGAKYIEQSEFLKAKEVLYQNFKQVKKDTREYSMYTAIFAYLYERMGDFPKQKYYLTLSAISDIKSAVKENHALRSLATILYEEGDYSRANIYIKKSLEDANFYNSRLRNIQSSKVLSIVDKAYEIEKQKKDRQLRYLIITLSLLSVVLALSFYFIYRQVLKVSHSKKQLDISNSKLLELNEDLLQANKTEKQINEKLQEANLVKEQYIRSFLEICTEYIQKLDSFKQIVQRKLKTGQTAEALKFVSDHKGENKENKDLYRNFDHAFLNVYPFFEQELNKLLKEDEQYVLKKDMLNQELRIYALIRLGVTDNSQIAAFLHYTLRTVYNYRSRVKQKAIQPELFEDQICKIGMVYSQSK